MKKEYEARILFHIILNYGQKNMNNISEYNTKYNGFRLRSMDMHIRYRNAIHTIQLFPKM